MAVGRVKWYDKSKGYGFIENPQGDVFFHFSDILMEGFKALAEDQRVSYKMVRSPQGLKAKDIRPMDNRASVRHAARYRNLMFMRVKEGCEDEFDAMWDDIPAWMDAMEQDLGVRRIGAWREGRNAVFLFESDRPYEQALQAAREHESWDDYQARQETLGEMLDDGPSIMSPIQGEVPVEEEQLEEEHTPRQEVSNDA